MPMALQAKILRLLQEQAFERVGGNEMVRTDVRLIAATHRGPGGMVGRGQVPAGPVLPARRLHHSPAPLRERAATWRLLVRHYLRRFSHELGREVQEGRPGGAGSACAATAGQATSGSCRAF